MELQGGSDETSRTGQTRLVKAGKRDGAVPELGSFIRAWTRQRMDERWRLVVSSSGGAGEAPSPANKD